MKEIDLTYLVNIPEFFLISYHPYMMIHLQSDFEIEGAKRAGVEPSEWIDGGIVGVYNTREDAQAVVDEILKEHSEFLDYQIRVIGSEEEIW
jgi:hypothetical protein